mmetsp:Transcript_18826/g.36924  ORF Transcript_18826/g.36924 Transcript_18826/m.36924 type:complete len:215 (-) Transcript_18826:386-1030(-)
MSPDISVRLLSSAAPRRSLGLNLAVKNKATTLRVEVGVGGDVEVGERVVNLLDVLVKEEETVLVVAALGEDLEHIFGGLLCVLGCESREGSGVLSKSLEFASLDVADLLCGAASPELAGADNGALGNLGTRANKSARLNDGAFADGGSSGDHGALTNLGTVQDTGTGRDKGTGANRGRADDGGARENDAALSKRDVTRDSGAVPDGGAISNLGR